MYCVGGNSPSKIGVKLMAEDSKEERTGNHTGRPAADQGLKRAPSSCKPAYPARCVKRTTSLSLSSRLLLLAPPVNLCVNSLLWAAGSGQM